MYPVSYSDLSGKKYILGQLLGMGGEGTVYEIDGDSSLAAKIYRANRFVCRKIMFSILRANYCGFRGVLCRNCMLNLR